MEDGDEPSPLNKSLLERNCTTLNLMIFFLGVVFWLFFRSMWPECWAIDWIQGIIRVCIAIILQSHLAEWQQRLQVGNRFLVLSNSAFRCIDKVLDFLQRRRLLLIDLSRQAVSWIRDLQSLVLFLEGIDHASDWNCLLVSNPIDLWWIFRIGEDAKVPWGMKNYDFELENYYLIKF